MYTRELVISFIVITISNTAISAQPIDGQNISSEEWSRIDSHINNLHKNANIVKKYNDSYGKEVSCVDINKQPAMMHPALASHKVQLEPSVELKAVLKKVKSDETKSQCPVGSVEMLLPDREQIARFGSLSSFLSKYPNKINRKDLIHPNSTIQLRFIHEYATYWQKVNSMAAQSTFNIWRPAVSKSSEFSLSQLWMVGGSGIETQTIEVGAQTYPQLYGDYSPHLFIYFTSDNYNNTGCYNLSCGAFIQTSNVIPIGGVLPASTQGGAQVEGTVAFYRDPTTGNWILFYVDGNGNYIQSGYYPRALFGQGQLSRFAQDIGIGGEIYTPSSTTHTTTDMGSGAFSNAGYTKAAYQRNIKYMNTSLSILNFYAQRESVTNHSCYSATLGTNPAWESSMYFGGPGRNSLCP